IQSTPFVGTALPSRWNSDCSLPSPSFPSRPGPGPPRRDLPRTHALPCEEELREPAPEAHQATRGDDDDGQEDEADDGVEASAHARPLHVVAVVVDDDE